MSKVLNELIEKLQGIGDSLRTTNLVRGQEIHQLCDDFRAALPAIEAERKELVEALKWAMARINNPGVQEFGCSFCSAVFAGPNAQSDHNLKCPYGKALKQLVLALVKEK